MRSFPAWCVDEVYGEVGLSFAPNLKVANALLYSLTYSGKNDYVRCTKRVAMRARTDRLTHRNVLHDELYATLTALELLAYLKADLSIASNVDWPFQLQSNLMPLNRLYLGS